MFKLQCIIKLLESHFEKKNYFEPMDINKSLFYFIFTSNSFYINKYPRQYRILSLKSSVFAKSFFTSYNFLGERTCSISMEKVTFSLKEKKL